MLWYSHTQNKKKKKSKGDKITSKFMRVTQFKDLNADNKKKKQKKNKPMLHNSTYFIRTPKHTFLGNLKIENGMAVCMV